MKVCYSCKKQVSVVGKPGRSDTCPHCDADLRCCFNCRFYDPKAYNQCRETQAERVLDKDRGNFCEYFSFKDSSDTAALDSLTQKKQNPLDTIFNK
jgi:hypothetical protein